VPSARRGDRPPVSERSKDRSYLPQRTRSRGCFSRNPSLPLGVGVHVRAVVVEEVTLNVGFAWLVQERVVRRSRVGIVLLGVRVVADMTRPRGV